MTSFRLWKRLTVVIALSSILTRNQENPLLKLAALVASLLWFAYDHYYRSNTPSAAAAADIEAHHLQHHKVATAVMNLVCGYDPCACDALTSFAPVVKGSRCLFARQAVLWGSMDYRNKDDNEDDDDDIESHVQRSVPMLLQFLLRNEPEGLDGFVFEIRDEDGKHGASVEAFQYLVRRVLVAISDMDPNRERSARKRYVGDRAWHFVFAGVPIFVTTFAPCYPRTHSRFSYGASSCFVLLQPEHSFLRADLPRDTPKTEWDDPQTVRDRIRVAFRKAGQGYFIPDSTSYAASEHIVKPLDDDGMNVVRWWLSPSPSGAGKEKKRRNGKEEGAVENSNLNSGARRGGGG